MKKTSNVGVSSSSELSSSSDTASAFSPDVGTFGMLPLRGCGSCSGAFKVVSEASLVSEASFASVASFVLVMSVALVAGAGVLDVWTRSSSDSSHSEESSDSVV